MSIESMSSPADSRQMTAIMKISALTIMNCKNHALRLVPLCLLIALPGCGSAHVYPQSAEISTVLSTESTVSGTQHGELDVSVPSEASLSAPSASGSSRGYDLPVSSEEKETARRDCERFFQATTLAFSEADKGTASNTVLSSDALRQIQKQAADSGFPVFTADPYSETEQPEAMETFLENCKHESTGEAVLYKLLYDGGVRRLFFSFDGSTLFVTEAELLRNRDNSSGSFSITKTRIETWDYTEKGWFCYELCVPEPPEVSEIVNGCRMIRLLPRTDEQRTMTLRCVAALGYQENNLLCSDWDSTHTESLDFSGIFLRLYATDCCEEFPAADYPAGIPASELEPLLLRYLPITAAQLHASSSYDPSIEAYAYSRHGGYAYKASFFSTSLPEVTAVHDNGDGTMTLTIDAVCSLVVCNDALITHELTVRLLPDGQVQYLGNRIVKDMDGGRPEYKLE